MIGRFHESVKLILPEFYPKISGRLNPYFIFKDYRKIWGIGITLMAATAIVPLAVATITYYQMVQRSIDSELVLRTERLASNARRAVTFFLEERLDALKFTVNEIGFDQLTDADHLVAVHRNLRLGFGGLEDLSVISDTGVQIAYAGAFKLEGKNYGNQAWFEECKQHNYYVSKTFNGYRNVPHMIIAVRGFRPNGSFFILRATLEIERLFQTLSSYEPGAHADIFLTNRSFVLQTPSKYYGDIFEKMSLPPLDYSRKTQTVMSIDNKLRSIITGYAFITTKQTDTPFILMVVKQKAGMIRALLAVQSNFNWVVGLGTLIIIVVVTVLCTVMVNLLFRADRSKAETMVLMEQSNRLASIGQLAAGVAHEINNPLALINQAAGYIKDLFVIEKRYQSDEALMESIDCILDAGDKCATITKQLLGFARNVDTKIQKVNIREVISDVLIFHEKEAAYRNISVSVSMPKENLEIKTDPGKLEQILLNLVTNAFHAIEDGRTLKIQASSSDDEAVVISVSDNGCGIPKENLEKIFEPFFTTKQKNHGTGLGLAITYGLVKKLHGSISVESKENEGTTFTITLPIRIQEEEGKNEDTLGG
jgi:two-component system NtrC family sensor kinase